MKGSVVVRYQVGRHDVHLLSQSSLILVTGSSETVSFCNAVVDEIREMQKGEIWICETLAEFAAKAKNPAFLGRWWYTGTADRLTAEDTKAFNRLLKNPVKYGTAVLIGVDFTKYSKLTREIKPLKHMHEVTASFPSKQFLVNSVQQGVTQRGKVISQGAAEGFIWRLGDKYSKYNYYIDLLVAECAMDEIKASHVGTVLRGVTGASFEEFLKYLVRPLSNGELKRSTKMFKCYRCMVDEGAAVTLRKLHYKALQYLELRRLINEGYIPAAVEFSVDDLSKFLGEPPEAERKENRKFTRWDILKWSDIKLNREVKMAVQAPLADWFAIAVLSAKPYVTDEEAERVLYSILTRSRRTDMEILN